MRCLFVVATVKGYPWSQLDVNNTFLHGGLDEESDMNPPPSFLSKDDSRVCRLYKSYMA